MAYGDHYRIGYSSGEITGYINIWEEGYSSSIVDLTLVANTLKIDYKPNGWENPLIGLAASFGILNDEADFFTLLPLLTATEKQYWVRITRVSPSSLTLFEGYVACNNNEQKYLKNRSIRLVATSYLSKLRYVTPPSIETLQTISFIDYLDDCLRQTGTQDNIRVNSSLYPTEDTIGATSSMFNKGGIFSEVFHKNNIDRDNALDVITKILKTFDCYIYWYAENWYIERYNDIYNATTQTYVEYNSGDSYGPADTAASHSTSYTPIDFQDLSPIGQSQTIGVIQGLKEIEVKIPSKRYTNLVPSHLYDALPITSSPADPDARTWEYWNVAPTKFNSSTLGNPYRGIISAISRSGFYTYGGGLAAHHIGIYTKLKVTVATLNTSLEVRFKFATAKGTFGTWTSWEDFEFNFYYWLRRSGTTHYLEYNPATGIWSVDTGGDEITSKVRVIVEGHNFDDGSDTCDVSFSVPLSDVSGLATGDHDLVLCIGTERIDNGTYDDPATSAAYGDIVIRTTGTAPNNNFKGTISTDMLNKLSIEVPFSDFDSLNFKNAIFRGTGYATRTTTWTDDGINHHKIATQKIKDRFRLYRIPRQRIIGKISTSTFHRPLRNFTDSEQSGKQFVLMGFKYYPERDQMDIILMEYDNTETITIS